MPEKVAVKFKNVKEVLDYAIKSEESAYAFYMGWAKKIEDRSLVLVFEELAREELGHKEFLQGVKKGVSLVPSRQEIVDLKISDYVMDVNASMDMDYQEALILAMKREKEAFKLYTGLAAMSEKDDLRDTFKALAQEEAKHKLRLELMYDDDILKDN